MSKVNVSSELMAVAANVREFRNKESAVRMSGELSNTGKNARLEQLARERQAYRDTVVRVAISAYDNLLARFDANDKRRKAAQEDASARWDYERLNYQARAAETRVKLAGDIASLERLYEAALNSGDKHAFRSFCEVASGEVRSRWMAVEPDKAHLLIRRMEKDLEQVLTSPELLAIQDRGAALAGEAMELRVVLDELHSAYGGAVSGWLGLQGDDELGWMVNSIHQTPRILGNGDVAFDVEILPWRAERDRMRGIPGNV